MLLTEHRNRDHSSVRELGGAVADHRIRRNRSRPSYVDAAMSERVVALLRLMIRLETVAAGLGRRAWSVPVSAVAASLRNLTSGALASRYSRSGVYAAQD